MKNYLLSLLLLFSLSTFAEQGDSFNDPIPITTAGNITFPEGKSELYYSFTLTETTVIVLSEHSDYYTDVFDANENIINYGYSGEQKYRLDGGAYVIKVTSYVSNSFDWSITFRDVIEGEYCDAPISLSESGSYDAGDNKHRAYYTFIASKPGLIYFENITNAALSIQPDCDSDPISTSYSETSHKLEVEADKTYIIFANAYDKENFSFDFNVSYDQGDNCANPVQISGYGLVTSPIHIGTRYYSFTTPQAGKFNITLDSSLVSNEPEGAKGYGAITLHADCIDVQDDRSIATSQNGILTHTADANETFIIKVGVSVDEFTNETFNLKIAPDNVSGGSCENAINISEAGDINFPAGKSELFYKYTATKNGKLVISNGDSDSESVTIYNDCESSQYLDSDYSGDVTIDVVANESYIIKWEADWEQTAFTWSLSEVDYSDGEICSKPITATEGINTCTNTEGEIYFSYTARKNGILTLSNNDFHSSVGLLSKCNNQLKYNNRGELAFECINGATYIIKWNNEEYQTFDWTLSIVDAQEGETCTSPSVISSVGTTDSPTELELKPVSMYQHYSFTTASNQMISISDGEKYSKVAVATECNFNNAQYGNSGELDFAAAQGTTYHIRWESFQMTVPWTISGRDLEPGETTINPIVINSVGEITYSGSLKKVYYSYTPVSSVVINTTTESSANNYDNNKQVNAGETIILEWNNNDKADFTWTLSERALIDGENCSKALTANAGDVVCNADLTLVYYKYTVTSNSLVSITDNSDEHMVNVAKACNDYSFYYTKTKGEISAKFNKGDIIVIDWGKKSDDEFTWNISQNNLQTGETMDDPIIINEPGSINVHGYDKGLILSYYKYTPAESQEVTLSAGDYAYIIDAETKDTLQYGSYEDITFAASKNKSYIISWLNTYSGYENISLSAKSVGKNQITFVVSNGEEATENASISINGQTLNTNNNGNATITLEEGNYDFTITKSGYLTHSGNVSVEGYDATVTSVLTVSDNPSYGITFRVSDQNGAVNGANITVNDVTVSTASEGWITIQLENGTYPYSITAAGRDTVTGSVTVNSADTEVNVTLNAQENEMHTVTFKVTNQSVAVENASIAIEDSVIYTNNEGVATIKLYDGVYSYLAKSDDHEGLMGTVTVNGADISETVTLDTQGSEEYILKFIIMNSGNTIEGASITINDSTLTTNASGEASLNLANGTYSYNVSADGYQDYTQQITMNGEDKELFVNIIAEGVTSYTLTFEVTDGTNAIEGAVITINDSEITTNTGGVAEISLPDGTYQYSISAVNFEDYSNEVVISGDNLNEKVSLTGTVGIAENITTTKLYPNPARSVINVSSDLEITSLKIYSITGVLLKQQNGINNSIAINKLNNGVYLLNIQHHNKSEFIRFIKE